MVFTDVLCIIVHACARLRHASTSGVSPTYRHLRPLTGLVLYAYDTRITYSVVQRRSVSNEFGVDNDLAHGGQGLADRATGL